jgi:hypothetical protein
MMDPIRIENVSQRSILSICFDINDTYLTVTTEDYKIQFYNLSNLSIDGFKPENIELSMQYLTKKTTILVMKYTKSNVLLCLGRYDDNDPKIFM